MNKRSNCVVALGLLAGMVLAGCGGGAISTAPEDTVPPAPVVGLEAHGTTLDAWYDRVKTSLYLATDRVHALRQAIGACRKGGTVSIPGVYGGLSDKIPMGALMNKGLTIKTGQTHVHRYVPGLLDHIRAGRIDPSFVVTHRMPLSEAPHGYEIFREKQDGCIKIVLDPAA